MPKKASKPLLLLISAVIVLAGIVLVFLASQNSNLLKGQAFQQAPAPNGTEQYHTAVVTALQSQPFFTTQQIATTTPAQRKASALYQCKTWYGLGVDNADIISSKCVADATKNFANTPSGNEDLKKAINDCLVAHLQRLNALGQAFLKCVERIDTDINKPANQKADAGLDDSNSYFTSEETQEGSSPTPTLGGNTL